MNARSNVRTLFDDFPAHCDEFSPRRAFYPDQAPFLENQFRAMLVSQFLARLEQH